ncbi:HMP-PP phosphatase [Salmonella enterica subsp. enterica]|uniref:HMP-PP phosphatase n=1 Tax=Salmonella enterica I TaxID=59201 RepID=A0A379WDT5_SALET|nr:HMP-PP phosphatase [Salmonella enterica subsp. enterica]
MARLAAFDMDGTLLMPDHHLGRETIATLARLRERDITLTFATGRHVLEMRHILGRFHWMLILLPVTGREFTRWKATCCIVRISILRLPIR